MEENIDSLRKKIEKLIEEGNLEDINSLSLSEKETDRKKEIYLFLGNAWYQKKEYSKAITYYSESLKVDPSYELALYNKGLALVAIKEYDNSIKAYTKAINLGSEFSHIYYNERGKAFKAKQKYEKAISDYNEAIRINPNFATAYYNRGLAKKEKKNITPEEIKLDFENYLKLTIETDEIWAKRARFYIEEINERTTDPELWSIKLLINDIKDQLLIKEECVTHYTGLSIIKKLILDESKFKISEGNYMNDPSEGKEFYSFLKYKPFLYRKDKSNAVTFSPMPFIGSFVIGNNHNNLNLWRLYGKEKGIEAKGCAITLQIEEFIEEIKDILSNEKKEARLDNESDINFYRVAYITEDSTAFYIPTSDKGDELTKLMLELKRKVKEYKVKNKTPLEKYLNCLAFLFKSDSYKNENEVRLVVKGFEFEKKYDLEENPPRVYIELDSIKKIVKQITLGPKVDRVNEWASAFHHSYQGDVPKIIISHLPYK